MVEQPDRFEELLDIVERQERELLALRQEVQKLQGFDLGNAMMFKAFMSVLSARQLVRNDDLLTMIQSLIAEGERGDTAGIRKHALDHLRRLCSTVLLEAGSSTPQ